MEGLNEGEARLNELSGVNKVRDSFEMRTSPTTPLSPQSRRSESSRLSLHAEIDTSIEQLYHNVCDMQSSVDQSPSRASFLSYGEESRIDSELCHLVGGDATRVEQVKEVVVEVTKEMIDVGMVDTNRKSVRDDMLGRKSRTKSGNGKKGSQFRANNEASARSSSRTNSSTEKLQLGKQQQMQSKKVNAVESNLKLSVNGAVDLIKEGPDNSNAGIVFLKQARDLLSSNNPKRALRSALKAKKAFEACPGENLNLDMVMCLHVLAAVYCNLGEFDHAIPILERSIEIPMMDKGQNHALAKFAGCMQLGDTYVMLGQLENSVLCYSSGLEIQKQILGENDSRVGETCRYVAEAYVQALQFDEAEKLCQTAINIHKENNSPGSIQEAADRRLMGLICDSKGNHEAAIEHYVLASMYMATYGSEVDMASIDCSIGDAYLSLARYDEATSAYQKALSGFMKSKGENHPTVASVYARLADLSFKIGQLKESKCYCEDALCIYQKPIPGIPAEEYASGFVDVSAIFESMNNLKMALKLLGKALKIYESIPGQQSTIAGIEAQMGVMNYVMGSYPASYDLFNSAIMKFRASSEKKSALFGIALNQMGLACVQCNAIGEAAELFQEARDVLENEHGPYHPDTLGVYSNLAGTYDAMGRLNDAIEILEHVVGMREEKLGTANPDVDDEKRRLAELLHDAGRVRKRKSIPLEHLLGGNASREHIS